MNKAEERCSEFCFLNSHGEANKMETVESYFSKSTFA